MGTYKSFTVETYTKGTTLRFSPNGDLLAIAFSNGIVIRETSQKDNPKDMCLRENRIIKCIKWSNNQTFLTQEFDGTLCLWHIIDITNPRGCTVSTIVL